MAPVGVPPPGAVHHCGAAVLPRLPLPAGGIALSPTTDFTLASDSLRTVSDPIISAKTMPVFRDHYLGKTDPRNPLASPSLFGAPSLE